MLRFEADFAADLGLGARWQTCGLPSSLPDPLKCGDKDIAFASVAFQAIV